MQVYTDGRTVDLRFSSLPGIFGEKIVLRILDKDRSIVDIDQLGMSESKLTTWLYAIGINLARASLRKSRRLSSLEDQEVERMQPTFNRGMFVETPAAWDPEKLTELSDRQQIVRKGIEQLPEGGEVTVTGRRDGSDLVIAMSNPVASGTERSKGGNKMAMDNIRQRFELAYVKRATVEVSDERDRFTVSLRFPLEEGEA